LAKAFFAQTIFHRNAGRCSGMRSGPDILCVFAVSRTLQATVECRSWLIAGHALF